jgi:hypothetical protein
MATESSNGSVTSTNIVRQCVAKIMFDCLAYLHHHHAHDLCKVESHVRLSESRPLRTDGFFSSSLLKC